MNVDGNVYWFLFFSCAGPSFVVYWLLSRVQFLLIDCSIMSKCASVIESCWQHTWSMEVKCLRRYSSTSYILSVQWREEECMRIDELRLTSLILTMSESYNSSLPWRTFSLSWLFCKQGLRCIILDFGRVYGARKSSERRFLSDPGVPGVRSMGPDVSKWLQDYFADLTDVTLADEDSNSIPTDDVNRPILGNVATQVMPPGAKLKLMQVAPLGGQTCN